MTADIQPTNRGKAVNRIREALRRATDFNAKAAAAQPGELWTARYVGADPVHGEHFESYTAGTVRVLGDECPVVEYRGQKMLGEWRLDSQGRLWRTFCRLDALLNSRRLDRGDTAPDMAAANGATDEYLARDHAGDFLAELPNRAWVTVEWREPHPVYAGQRNVTVGYAYDRDERGGETGRDVGGDWIAFDKVTAVISHSHAEVGS